MDFLNNLFKGAAQAVTNVVQKILKPVVNVINQVVNAVTNTVNALTGGVSSNQQTSAATSQKGDDQNAGSRTDSRGNSISADDNTAPAPPTLTPQQRREIELRKKASKFSGQSTLTYGRALLISEGDSLGLCVASRLNEQGIPPVTVTRDEFLGRFALFGWNSESDAAAQRVWAVFTGGSRAYTIQDQPAANAAILIPEPTDYLEGVYSGITSSEVNNIRKLLQEMGVPTFRSLPQSGGRVPAPITDPLEIEALQRGWLQSVFGDAANLTNYPQFTNMSNPAFASFLFSVTRQEDDTWDRYDPSNPAEVYASNPEMYKPAWSSVQGSGFLAGAFPGVLWNWIRERAESDKPQRLAGISYGMSNIYPRGADEAWNYMNAAAPALPWDNIRSGSNLDLIGGRARDMNISPSFSARMLGVLFGWGGARQRTQIGAGSQDYPALTPEDAQNPNFSQPTGSVSGFSLIMIKNADSVDAEYSPSAHAAYGNEFNKSIRAVEEMPNAAMTLGYNFVYDPNYVKTPGDTTTIVLFQDFTPYNKEQTMELVTYYASNDVGKLTLGNPSELVLLKLSYEYYNPGKTFQSYLDENGIPLSEGQA
jgi:hypothetical protein